MPAELIRVIRTDLTLRGRGTPADVSRRVTEYWSEEGELLAEVDGWWRQQARLALEELPKVKAELAQIRTDIDTDRKRCGRITEAALIYLNALTDLKRLLAGKGTKAEALARIEKAIAEAGERSGLYKPAFSPKSGAQTQTAST